MNLTAPGNMQMMYITPQECLFGLVKTLSHIVGHRPPAELKLSQEHNNLVRRQCLFYFEKRKEESRNLAGIWCEGLFVFVFCLVWVFPREALCCGNLSVKVEGGNEASFWRLTSFKVCQSCNSKSRMEIECVWHASAPPECRLIR